MLATYPPGVYANSRGDPVPTRRIMELTVLTVIAVRPAFGLARLWASKTLASTTRGNFVHGVAEIVTVLA